MWPARRDTERCYLLTVVVPIYLLAYCILHAFKLLGWWELGQATGAHSITWIRSYDCRSSDLAAQRFLRFNLQHHHMIYIPGQNIPICFNVTDSFLPVWNIMAGCTMELIYFLSCLLGQCSPSPYTFFKVKKYKAPNLCLPSSAGKGWVYPPLPLSWAPWGRHSPSRKHLGPGHSSFSIFSVRIDIHIHNTRKECSDMSSEQNNRSLLVRRK